MRNVLDVLIVDDDPKTRQDLRVFLGPLSEQMFEAENGRQALPLIQQHDPDLLIIDILMPDMDGLETIRLLREQGHELPIIAMTAGAEVAEQSYGDYAKSFGADGVLPKPFTVDDVLKAVRQSLTAANRRML